MTHRVVIQQSALGDLEEITKGFDGRTEIAGPAWYDRLVDHIFTLEDFPSRCPIAEVESERLGIEVRCLLFGSRQHTRRLLYTIVGQTVQVLHVWHGARDR